MTTAENHGPAQSLTTERLTLRWFTEGDAELMLAVWNDPDFVRHVGDRGIRTPQAAREALRDGILAMYRTHGYGPYRVSSRETDTPMGICGLFHRDYLDDPDIGFGLLPRFCGQGYAHESASKVMEHARDVLGLARVTAMVSPGNAPSIGLIEKLGLKREGRITPPQEQGHLLLYAIEYS